MEPSGLADPEVRRLGSPDDDPGATRWTAGRALPASRSAAASLPGASQTGASESIDSTTTGQWRRIVLRAGQTISAEHVEFQPAPTPPELLTPPDFVALLAAPLATVEPAGPESSPTSDRVALAGDPTSGALSGGPAQGTWRIGDRLAIELAEDLLPLPAEVRSEPEDPGPPGPFGGPAARDYRYAVADRLPRAIRLLMPTPAVPSQALPRSYAIESGRRQSDLELRLEADRVRREALAAEAHSSELRRQAVAARDQAYEARATWQWTSHQRAALAEELRQLTAAANSVVEEQRCLSEQARQALRDVAAWDAWIGQLEQETQRLAGEHQQADSAAANARAEQGRGQAALLRDWLDRAERRFRQLSAQLEALGGQRDIRTSASVEMAARQQLLVDRYQRLGGQAQRWEREALEQASAAFLFRVEARERVVDLTGLRPDLSRWVNGAAVALVRGGGRHSPDAGRSAGGGGRRYDVPAGYRRPLRSEHRALEEALPRRADGSFGPAPEPAPGWVSLLNGVGGYADQSRAQNCVDATLALLDTYVRGRPRVAAPRIVDAHRSGTTRLPLRGEPRGRRRLEDAIEGNLQLLFAQVGAAPSRFQTYQLQAAFDTVADHLRQAGHGAFGAVLAGWQDGDSRSTAAVNHEGTVRWIDAQLGTVADAPMPVEWVRTLEVAMLDPAGLPWPLPGLPISPWTTRPASPAYAAAVTEPAPSGFPPPSAVLATGPAVPNPASLPDGGLSR